MILVTKKDGIVTMEMSENDALALARIISSMEEEAKSFLENWEREIQETLPSVLLQ